MTSAERADLAALVDLASVAAGGFTDTAFRLAGNLAVPAEVPNPEALAKPAAAAESELRNARHTQRSTAAAVQQLDQVVGTLKRQALGLESNA